MRTTLFSLIGAVLALSLPCQGNAEPPVELSEHVSLVPGPVNSVIIEKDDSRLVVYGDPAGAIEEAEMVLFTHSRRDVAWAGRKLIENGATAVVPAGEAEMFSGAEKFWSEFTRRRFHDYAQQGSKVLTTSLKVGRAAGGGDELSWRGVPIQVLDTPGYTRGAVSYVMEIDGLRYGFVGDIIYGDGRLLDLYSVQDAIAEARIGGYHGWAGRTGELIQSLLKVADSRCDILIPARGPLIRDPGRQIARLIERLRAVYRNYLSISAGRWYFKDSYDTLARRVLGNEPEVGWMPWAEVIEEKPPSWIIPISNSRLIISEDGSGFLVDCGSRQIVEEVIKLREEGRLARLEGLFITHYHDDHTNDVAACLSEFNCPVYATGPSAEILKHPEAYRLPCLTANPIPQIQVMGDAQQMRWKEFTLTFRYFPGQTIYHDALLVEKDNAEKIFFIGDSFTPSGIDDYCLLNRNLMHQGTGYFYCLELLRRIPAGTLLINQHVVEPFGFNARQLELMEGTLAERKGLLADLFAWGEANCGIDERWVRFAPYGIKTQPGGRSRIGMKVYNHFDVPHVFSISLNTPSGFTASPTVFSVTVSAKSEQQVGFEVAAGSSVQAGVHVVTADVEWEKWSLGRWAEAIIEVD